MKKAAIISCNDNYDYDTRTKYVCRFLETKGYKVHFIVADFDHRKKTKYVAKHPGDIEYIAVPEYKKNLSVSRIVSHIQFASKVGELVSKREYDLVYHCAPPNSTIKSISKAKKRKQFMLITEIGDMWPETMPINSRLKAILFAPFYYWRSLRDNYLFNSDVIIAECDLFKERLVKNTGLKNIETLYFCKEEAYVNYKLERDMFDTIELCYLGSINNIVDYDIVGVLVKELSKRKRIRVHIIGDGEKKNMMIKQIEESGGEVCFYGMVFDDEKKKSIFSKCHYALNVMKTDVFVGMTMKSLDYFCFGLPVINNIGADIGRMVSEYKIGFNIDMNNYKAVSEGIIAMRPDEYSLLRKNVEKAHRLHFSIESFDEKMKEIIGGEYEENSCV